jgi:hypothetical protein
MMDRKKAAEYFVVAWVKGWSLRMYLQVVAAGGAPIKYDAAQALYPWLPDEWAFIRQHRCRSHLAESNRPLSDALWDCADNRARLALAPQIEAFVFKGRNFQYLRQAKRASDWAKKRLRGADLVNMATGERVDRAGGHHWKVCK